MKNTLEKTKNIMRINNIKANKRFGQNFLIDDNVVGTAGIDKSWYSNDEYWILTVFIKPENHGQGIGKKLIEKIEEYATTLPVKKLIIPASITAHKFYYKLGYKYKDGKKNLMMKICI